MQIAGNTFDIRVTHDDPEAAGRVDYDERWITINGRYCQEERNRSFAHEIMHVLLKFSGAHEYLESFNVNIEVLVRILETPFWKFLEEQGFDFEKYVGGRKA